jgi:Zn-dependent peptidase ImmA (M78 family)/transcriptional regulator with XRE-family HTH domain
MPKVNHEILTWARETAGLSRLEAAKKLGIKDSKDITAESRVAALETGDLDPSRPLLLKMARHYRRPLVTFYMSSKPAKGDRGEDFRNLPDRHTGSEALVDALVRDIRARQDIVRSILVDEEEAKPVSFIGSLRMADGVGAVLAAMRQRIGLDLADFRLQSSPESAFALLRSKVEAAGVFVLLIGNLGSHHTAIGVEVFRGFALADPIAPFIVINDQDARPAWSFTLVHELAHLWLGKTGISGGRADLQIERFCNSVAASFLLPANEIPLIGVNRDVDQDSAISLIAEFAESRHLSGSMVAYSLFQAGLLTEDMWNSISRAFQEMWRRSRDARRAAKAEVESSGPDYYVVRRHRLGSALLRFVSRNISEGTLSHTKASAVLGVKPRSVAPLLDTAALSSERAA